MCTARMRLVVILLFPFCIFVSLLENNMLMQLYCIFFFFFKEFNISTHVKLVLTDPLTNLVRKRMQNKTGSDKNLWQLAHKQSHSTSH